MTSEGPTVDGLLVAAAEAAPHWGLEPATITLLSHSENAVFDVALTDGSHLALRIHRPGYNTLEEMHSEVIWVESLAASGIGVPRALPTVEGHHYVPVVVDGGERLAGLISWVEGISLGDALGAAGMPPTDDYRRIGEIAASIRLHNAMWEPPPGFVRRRWDADGLVGPKPVWSTFWDVEGLTPSQRTLFGQVRDRLYAELSALSVGPERFGLIHADLHLGNLMADGERLTVIDFDDAGFGWYAHEIAVALHSAYGEESFDDARDAMVAGYRSVHPLGDDELQLVETFVTVRTMMIVGWLSNRPEVPAYVHLPEIIAGAEHAAIEYLGA